ncbi:MAG: prepilin peptidase [Candidatus Dormibacteraeota bacterium]|nr:prepilin peptidase [Candidatus Dormibacteraeota bacterium]
MAVVVVVFAALFGGAFGSFAGVVASRGLAPSLGGRSQCDSCARTLAWYELVPLVSFPALRGRCRTCRAGIGWRTYIWEVGGGVLAAAIALTVLLITGRAGS